MPARKILLLSVSAGAGHMRAAEALHRCAQEQFPGVATLHLDVMQYVTAVFRKIYSDWYVKLVHASPGTWRLLYEKTDEADPRSPMQRLRRATERLNTKALLRAVRAFGPDAVVCTHFLPAELLMHEIRRGRWEVPVWVQVTDFDLHHMWVMPHMTGYFAGNDEIAERMRQCIAPPARIHSTGIPVMPAFAARYSAREEAQGFGLDPARRMILLMGGGAGMGGLDDVARALLTIEHDFQLVALAGRNAAALVALQTLVNGPMDVALFVAYVSQFLCPTLQAGDIVIADNLACHKVKAVRQAIEAVGASICYLPPYSPDLNPIEKLFAKLKALLRKAATRTVDALWQEIGQLLDALPATQCRNYFASSGFIIA